MSKLFSSATLDWAKELGLAASPFFGVDEQPKEPERHLALLDGRSASFVCTEAERDEIDVLQSRDWRWSADLPHHVIVGAREVGVISGRGETARRFERSRVEEQLEE